MLSEKLEILYNDIEDVEVVMAAGKRAEVYSQTPGRGVQEVQISSARDLSIIQLLVKEDQYKHHLLAL